MLRAVWKWFRQDRNRQIFCYWDGIRLRRIDPLVVWDRLVSHPEFVEDRDVPAAIRGNLEAIRLVVKAVCDAFGCREWAESTPGLTRTELMDLLAAYYDYCEALKKNIAAPATSSPPTGSESSEQPSITNAESVFG